MDVSGSAPFRVVPMGYTVKWLFASWSLAKSKYSFSLAAGVIFALLSFTTSRVPYLGPVAQALVAALFMAGATHVALRLRRREPVVAKDFAIFFNDASLQKRMIPYLVFVAVLQVVDFSVHLDVGLSLLLLFSLISFIITFFMFFTIPLIVIRGMNTKDAIIMSVEACVANLGVFLANIFVLMAVMIFSVVLLVVPFVFVMLPLLMTYNYVVYASIFEGADPEDLIREFA